PDSESNENLGGDLSHPGNKPVIPLKYIGALSRFERKGLKENENHLLIVLSGPEPQRSILEDKLIDEVVHYNGTAEIVRGLPATDKLMPSTNQIHFYNHLSASELNNKLEEASFVISRCGYSTVMDLVKLKRKSILIPTPGQTEQEYLAKYLSDKKIAVCINQQDFSLKKSLQEAESFDYHFTDLDESLLKPVISNFLMKLKEG
ncbi:MAG: glycosyl transferase family 28, partial [Chitinophagaceae bacterium]|nr:glycosyl transferase family 28 [Chitinophagaceae bacterium]